jgi:hypothetical protein
VARNFAESRSSTLTPITRKNTSSTLNHGALDASSEGAGILSMPQELFLEIPQHLGPPIGLDQPLSPIERILSRCLPYSLNSDQCQTLRSLSQCNRLLRSVFLPLAWKYFDTRCTTYDHYDVDNAEDISENLESKNKGLIKNPALWPYVQYDSVAESLLSSTHHVFCISG